MRATAPSRPSTPRHTRRAPPPAARRVGGDRQVVCSKTLVAKPGNEEAVKAACQALVAACAPSPRAGVVEFQFHCDAYEPSTFHFWERYASNVALGRHNTRPDVVQFMESVVPLLEGPIGMVLYEWRDGVGLSAACAQGGPKSEGGLDDAPGGNGMAGGAGMKQTSATLELGVKGQEGEEKEAAWGMNRLRETAADQVAADQAAAAERESV